MNKRNTPKSAFRWIFFSILLLFVIFFGFWKLGIWKTEQEKQVLEPVFKRGVISSDIKEFREVIKDASKRMVKTEVQPEEKELQKPQQKVFTIQVASFQEMVRAEKVAGELKNKGYTPIVSSKDLGERGVWHRVLVGDFDTKNEASELLKMLRQGYKGSFIKFR